MTSLAPGLTLHTDVLPAKQQANLLALVDEWIAAGRAGNLKGKTYQKPPQEWIETGQSRECLYFGVRVKCNKVDNAHVEPMPVPLLEILDQLETGGIFTAAQRPDSCCINSYSEGSWLPPHRDSTKFARPFFTLSLLSEQEVVFATDILGSAGIWEGSTLLRVEMPVGSLLRVDGEAADEMRHALPRATSRRVSLTFRRLSDATRAHLEALREASTESKAARFERRRREKEAKGRVPLSRAAEMMAAKAAAKAATTAAKAATTVTENSEGNSGCRDGCCGVPHDKSCVVLSVKACSSNFSCTRIKISRTSTAQPASEAARGSPLSQNAQRSSPDGIATKTVSPPSNSISADMDTSLVAHALERAALTLPHELACRGRIEVELLATRYNDGHPDVESLARAIAQALVEPFLHPPGAVPKVTVSTPEHERAMHADLYWRCSLAVLLMPITSLNALARHHVDLKPSLAPDSAPEDERHAALVRCILPRFSMVCSTKEEIEEAARRKAELEALREQRTREASEKQGGVCV